LGLPAQTLGKQVLQLLLQGQTQGKGRIFYPVPNLRAIPKQDILTLFEPSHIRSRDRGGLKIFRTATKDTLYSSRGGLKDLLAKEFAQQDQIPFLQDDQVDLVACPATL
jgi:hypothetical protein